LPPKADIRRREWHVRYGPKADNSLSMAASCDGCNFSVMDSWAICNFTSGTVCIFEGQVGRICFAFSVLVLLSVSFASCLYVAAIMACSRDVAGFCNAAKSVGDRLAECTKAHFEEFSEPCKVALLKIAATREACRPDIGEKCPGVKLGAGRLFLCVKEHFSS